MVNSTIEISAARSKHVLGIRRVSLYNDFNKQETSFEVQKRRYNLILQLPVWPVSLNSEHARKEEKEITII